MTIQTYSVTLRIDVTADGTAAMDEVVRQGAIQLRSMAVLINNGRYRPKLTVARNDDTFGYTEIELDVPEEPA